MLIMVTVASGDPIAESIDIFDGLNKCFVAKTEQEFKYDFRTMKRDWVCVRIEGDWDYLLRYQRLS